MKRENDFIKFLKADVKGINNYLLIVIVFVVFIVVGGVSYALFNYTSVSNNLIKITYNPIDITKPVCTFAEQPLTTLSIDEEVMYTLNCTDANEIVTSSEELNQAIATTNLEIVSIEKNGENKTYSYEILVKGKNIGTGFLTLPEGVIKDQAGNSANLVTSTSLEVVEKVSAESES